MNERNPNSPDSSPNGVFVTEGMQVTIPSGGLTIAVGPDGKVEAKLEALHVGLDLTPDWLEIALIHLRACEDSSATVLAAHRDHDQHRKGASMRAEFLAGMQAVVASGVAIDAYYAAVKDRITLPEGQIRSWQDRRTARHRQIAEVLRRAFPMSEDSARQIREILKQNQHFRDRAIHPPAEAGRPVLHPEIGQPTEWRFVTFRFQNVKAVVGTTLSVVAQTSTHPSSRCSDAVRRYREGVAARIAPVVNAWEQRYGALFSRRSDTNEQPTGG